MIKIYLFLSLLFPLILRAQKDTTSSCSLHPERADLIIKTDSSCVEITYWSTFDKNKRTEIHYKNGEINGKYITWFPNGVMEFYTEDYISGKINGKYYWFYDNGNKKEAITATNDISNGKYIEWYNVGNIKEEGEYLKGNKIGKWTTYHPNGQKEKEGVYIIGLCIPICIFRPNFDFETNKVISNPSISKYRACEKKDGIWFYWNESGVLIKEEYYKKGRRKNTKKISVKI